MISTAAPKQEKPAYDENQGQHRGFLVLTGVDVALLLTDGVRKHGLGVGLGAQGSDMK